MVTQFLGQPTMLMGTTIDWAKGGKDLYGNSNLAKLARFFILGGMVYEGGKEAGYDLSKHVMPILQE